MVDYISRDEAIERIQPHDKPQTVYGEGYLQAIEHAVEILSLMPAADVQEKKYCKMIPLELDSRGCTNVFRCTNCHQYIYLGFIQKEYSGSYCSECGAEVERSIKIPKIGGEEQ